MKKNINKSMLFVIAGSMFLGSISPIFATIKETETITSNSTQQTEVFYNQESSFEVVVPKLVDLGKDKSTNYEVTVSGDISSDEVIKVVPEKSFLMNDKSGTTNLKADVEATVTQDKTEWIFNEFETKANGVISAPNLTAGNWEGSFFFNIKLDCYNISVIAKNEAGEDLNASATYITGKEKENLLDSLVDEGFINSVDEVDALINVKSDNFEGLADTTFDVSDTYEEGDEIIILHFDETKKEWEYIGQETVDSNGLISGDFTSYSPVAFVKVNEDGSFSSVNIEDKWTCDPKYIFEGTGTFAVIGGRTYNKTYEGKAVVATVKDTANTTLAMIASTDPNCMDTWCSYETTLRARIVEFEYLDMTWYISWVPYGWRENYSGSGFAQNIRLNMSVWNNLNSDEALRNIGKEFLKTIGVEVVK